MGIMSRAAGEPLRHVEVGEEGVDVNARVAGAQAEEGGEDDGQESASELDAAGEVLLVLRRCASGEKG